MSYKPNMELRKLVITVLVVAACISLLLLDAGAQARDSPSRSTGSPRRRIGSPPPSQGSPPPSKSSPPPPSKGSPPPIKGSSSSTGFCEAFVNPQNYKCSEDQVQTDDGYLLAVQKITSAKTPPVARGPAFLYHGIMQGGETWVLNPEENSLAFMMANAGYEVWIGNTRSTKYTFGHVKYNRGDKEFWNWNWDNLVKSDLPAMLQHVYDKSSQKIAYVGYSQGTMTALASFSQGNTVNLVSKATLLCPIGSLDNIDSALATAGAFLFADEVLLHAGVAEFNPNNEAGRQFLGVICPSSQIDCERELLEQLTGPNCCFDTTQKDYFEQYSMQSTSMRNLAHMAQMVRSGRFCKYDYGLENINKYNSLIPPKYDVSDIPASLPLFLVHGGQDALADPDDVEDLIEDLKGNPQVLLIPRYAHADFVVGTSAGADVYKPVIAFFQK